MKQIRYFMVPEWNSVFKATEDCCFVQVVYAGNEIGVKYKTDRDGDPLNSWDLFCHCHPQLRIIPIDQDLYQQFLEDVNERRRA
jgi:hypothetical protein